MTFLHPETHIGLVALTVANRERSVAFYQDVLGFTVIERGNAGVILGAGATAPLLLLTEQAGTRPKPSSTTGLYHFALLVPSRADLGRSLLHLAELRYPLDGYADHLVSESLYLSDPDGNGIEIYRDRPRSQWHWANGRVAMATDPLDIEGILSEGEGDPRPWKGLPPGTHMGHIHLQVGDLRQAEEFYHGVLGFDVTARMPGALFVSAGGYHHHIGMNTWQSRGAGPAPETGAGLGSFVIAMPDREALAQVRARLDGNNIPVDGQVDSIQVADPFGNRIKLVVVPSAR